MYGYLRLLQGGTLPSIQRYYRGLYCSLCHAMWNYYGNRSRFLLSYDMTFLSVVLDLNGHADLDSNFLCYKKSHIQTDQEKWKRISALSILLASMKLQDNIDDDKDIKAKIGMLLFRGATKRASLDYPEVAQLLKQGFADMATMERNNQDVFTLSHKFGDIMTNAVSLLFTCSEADYAIMKHVTEWVYFIDALDDLDRDSHDGNYNPFKSLASSKHALIK